MIVIKHGKLSGKMGKQAIEEAAIDFKKYTCIRLRPRTNQATYLKFYDGGQCSSPVGAVQSPLKVNGKPFCNKS